MKIFAHYGFNDFIICLGYKGYVIKEYFANYFMHQSDVTFDLKNNKMKIHRNFSEPWKVTLLDTGLNTMTGGRLLRVKNYIGEEPFMMTYGDGVADIKINDLVKFHKDKKQIATLTAVRPTGRFGALKIDKDNKIISFEEKPDSDGSWVNAGFFVLQPEVFNYLTDDETVFERDPLENLAKNDQLNAFYHKGFWMPMDKLSDKNTLEKMWKTGHAKWKIWK